MRRIRRHCVAIHFLNFFLALTQGPQDCFSAEGISIGTWLPEKTIDPFCGSQL